MVEAGSSRKSCTSLSEHSKDVVTDDLGHFNYLAVVGLLDAASDAIQDQKPRTPVEVEAVAEMTAFGDVARHFNAAFKIGGKIVLKAAFREV